MDGEMVKLVVTRQIVSENLADNFTGLIKNSRELKHRLQPFDARQKRY